MQDQDAWLPGRIAGEELSTQGSLLAGLCPSSTCEIPALADEGGIRGQLPCSRHSVALCTHRMSGDMRWYTCVPQCWPGQVSVAVLARGLQRSFHLICWRRQAVVQRLLCMALCWGCLWVKTEGCSVVSAPGTRKLLGCRSRPEGAVCRGAEARCRVRQPPLTALPLSRAGTILEWLGSLSHVSPC